MENKEKKLTVAVNIDIFSDGSSTSSIGMEGENPVIGLDTTMAIIAGLEVCKTNFLMRRYGLLPGSIATQRPQTACPYGKDDWRAEMWMRGFTGKSNLKAAKGGEAEQAWLEGKLAANVVSREP